MDSTDCVVESRSGRVATLTLHRPDRLNAWTTEMARHLFSCLHALDEDDDVRCIIVTGAGRAFCAGADLSSGGTTFAADGAFDVRALEEKVHPWNMKTPVIAAINGPAVGIGATLPLWWDFRIAAESARIGFVFTRRGITPEANCTWILPRLIGVSRALDVLLTGRILSAREALDMGIVSRVVPDDELMSVCDLLAREIVGHTAPVSVAVTKRLVWRQMEERDPRAAKACEDRWFRWIGGQPDAHEGIEAFLEKRSPRWKMRPSVDLPEEP